VSFIKFEVNAGVHNRKFCPIKFELDKNEILNINDFSNLVMIDDTNKPIPVQCVDVGDTVDIFWIIDDLAAGTTRRYELCDRCAQEFSSEVVPVNGENKIDINIDGKYFTSYVFDPLLAKPYLGPVIASGGSSYTRLEFDIKEHPHHRSVWVAIGDVNGVDFWNEPKGTYGKQKQLSITHTESGTVKTEINAKNVWTDFNNNPLLNETRKITFYNIRPDKTYIDMDIVFNAAYGKVVFGPTKEAGPLGVRVAESMKVNNGGIMVNSYGAVGEDECWGKRANWCDYHGVSGENRLGIAVFDHPDNENYPTYWHIRNYGLLAPNNFYFTGSRVLEKDEVLRYRYRIYFHNNDTTDAFVSERYHDYINPPLVKKII